VIGTDFAGRRIDTGERVFGLTLSRGISTFVYVGEDMIAKIPDHWSMEESVSVLSTYCTVWYGLIDRAQLTRSMNFKLKIK
jgi:NADPH:quinone reductase-like Zn-dependent oxidoreductase